MSDTYQRQADIFHLKLCRFFGGVTYSLKLDMGLESTVVSHKDEIVKSRKGWLEDIPEMKEQVQWLNIQVQIDIGVPHCWAAHRIFDELHRFKSLKKAEVTISSRSRVQEGMWPGLRESMSRMVSKWGVEVKIVVVWYDDDDASNESFLSGLSSNADLTRRWEYGEAARHLSEIVSARKRSPRVIELHHQSSSRILNRSALVDALCGLSMT